MVSTVLAYLKLKYANTVLTIVTKRQNKQSYIRPGTNNMFVVVFKPGACLVSSN